jgi:predicted dehydrogenase
MLAGSLMAAVIVSDHSGRSRVIDRVERAGATPDTIGHGRGISRAEAAVAKAVSRRGFLVGSVVGGLSARGALTRPAWAAPLGANDAVRVAVVGLGNPGKGLHHVQMFKALPGVRLVALCDVDENILDKAVKDLASESIRVARYVDVRKLLESQDVDAISIATPNHWHSLMTVWACQAGKDVYVEKPISHNVWEGRKAVEAAARFGRIVQAGTQSRSDEALLELVDFLRKGEMGKILRARGFCYKRRESIGRVAGPQPIPARVHYDLWCGPAPLEPLRRERLHYDWHWFWATGNGDIGNQGVHEMDMCRWMLGEEKLPPRVFSVGGRFGYVDDGQTPNTQIAVLDYPAAPILFEVRGLPQKAGVSYMDQYRGVRVGIVIEGENGYFAGGGGGGWTYDRNGKRVRQFAGSGGEKHAENFIRAVRSRKPEELKAPLLGGHTSSALCHLANISHRLGTQADEPELKAQAGSRTDVADALDRFEAHLGANGVDLRQARPVLGPVLDFLPGEERFASRSEYDLGARANRLLRDDYRPPFVVPEKL